MPKAAGGTDDPSNLAPEHRSCSRSGRVPVHRAIGASSVGRRQDDEEPPAVFV